MRPSDRRTAGRGPSRERPRRNVISAVCLAEIFGWRYWHKPPSNTKPSRKSHDETGKLFDFSGHAPGRGKTLALPSLSTKSDPALAGSQNVFHDEKWCARRGLPTIVARVNFKIVLRPPQMYATLGPATCRGTKWRASCARARRHATTPCARSAKPRRRRGGTLAPRRLTCGRVGGSKSATSSCSTPGASRCAASTSGPARARSAQTFPTVSRKRCASFTSNPAFLQSSSPPNLAGSRWRADGC
jgi:hypothetical protein